MTIKNGEVACPDCGKTFQTRDEYLSHRLYPCIESNVESTTGASNPSVWRCQFCDKILSTNVEDSHLTYHIASGHVVPKRNRNPSAKSTCHICKMGLDESRIKAHVEMHEVTVSKTSRKRKGGRRIWACPICGDVMRNIGRGKANHIRAHVLSGDKVPEDAVQEDVDWVCDICGIGLSDRSIARHKRYHAEAESTKAHKIKQLKGRWTCPVCDETMKLNKRGTHIWNHIRNGEKVPKDKIDTFGEWTCPLCRFSFRSGSRKGHIDMHEKEGHDVSKLKGDKYRGPLWWCPICKEELHAVGKFLHLVNHNERGEKLPPGVTITTTTRCNICGKTVPDNIFGKHMREHMVNGDKARVEEEAVIEDGLQVEDMKHERPEQPEPMPHPQSEPVAASSPIYRACPECKVIYRLDNKDHWFCLSCGEKLTEGWITQEIKSITGVVGKRSG